MLFFNNEMELIVCLVYKSICPEALFEGQKCLNANHFIFES